MSKFGPKSSRWEVSLLFLWLAMPCAAVLTGSMLPSAARAEVRQTQAVSSPDRKANEPMAVMAGGCFWGVDAVFKHVKGVTSVTSGYSGGAAGTAQYEEVSTGATGHAESVEIRYDPSKVSYLDLLKVFFLVAHDPTELNRQGPDEGTQYRSAIFYADAVQRRAAEDYIKQLAASGAFKQPIVTQVVPLKAFYPAEEYHQNFLARNPDNPYIVYNDLPKLAALKQKFPALYVP